MVARTEQEQDQEYATFYHAAGEVIREWAELEVAFEWHLAGLLCTESFRSRIVWASLPNFRARHQLISRLAETFVDDSILPKYRNLLKRIKKAAANRNTIAHCFGGLDGKPNHVVFLYDQDEEEQGYNFVGSQVVHIENIKDWARNVQALRGEILDLYKELDGKLHTLPKMHRVRRGDHPGSTPAGPQQEGDPGPQPGPPGVPPPLHLSSPLKFPVRYRWGR